jgi:hypothetical protein
MPAFVRFSFLYKILSRTYPWPVRTQKWLNKSISFRRFRAAFGYKYPFVPIDGKWPHVVSIVHSSHESAQGNGSLTCDLRPEGKTRQYLNTKPSKRRLNYPPMCTKQIPFRSAASSSVSQEDKGRTGSLRCATDASQRNLVWFLHCARIRVVKNILAKNDRALACAAVEQKAVEVGLITDG